MSRVGNLVPHHFGFPVEDLEASCQRWADVYGAGPFFVIESVAFDRLLYVDGDATFVHDAAMGQWGDVIIELQRFETVTPEPLARRLIGDGSSLNHISYASTTPERDGELLVERGYERYLEMSLGAMEFTFFDARQELGHSVEIHRDSAEFRNMFAGVRKASIGWRGERVTRSFDELTS